MTAAAGRATGGRAIPPKLLESEFDSRKRSVTIKSRD
jgi:hypothetical protein